METLMNDEILRFGVILMLFIGERLHYISIKLYFYRVFNSIVGILLLVFVLANFLQSKIETYVKNVQSVVSLAHILLKYLLYIYYKPDIDKTFEGRLKFWNYRNVDKKTMKITLKIYKVINIVQISTLVSSLIVMLLYFFKPAFDSNDIYLIDVWVFIDSFTLETIVLACQYYIFAMALPIVFGYDLIYLSFLAHIVLQVRFLKRKLKKLSKFTSNSAKSEVRYCIRHHQFLLMIFQQTKRAYSLMLLFHYFVTLTTGCVDLYELFIGKGKLSYAVMTIISLVLLYVQFGYYTIPAEAVASEFSSISKSIYMSKWYENSITLQKLLLLIMVKSQRQEYFMGGNMIEINMYTYGSVIRKTFSFYAILRTLLNK